MASEACPISAAIRQSKEVGLRAADRAFPDSMFERCRHRALSSRIGSCRTNGNARRLERAPFPGCPIERVSPVVSGRKIDEHHLVPGPDVSRDDVAHEELPVILVGDEDDIDAL